MEAIGLVLKNCRPVGGGQLEKPATPVAGYARQKKEHRDSEKRERKSKGTVTLRLREPEGWRRRGRHTKRRSLLLDWKARGLLLD